MNASSPGAVAPDLFALLALADRRRRARLLLESVGRWMWPALAAAAFLAAAHRVSGAGWLAWAWPLPVALAAVGGAAVGLRRGDLLAAAAELDRVARLDAALATGLEAVQGRIRGPLAAAVTAQAERLASGLRAEAVSVLPGGRSRYLAVPAAILAGLVLIPSGPAARGERMLVSASGPAPSGASEGLRRGAVPEDLGRAASPRARDGKAAPESRAGSVRRNQDQAERAADFLHAPLKAGRRSAAGRAAPGREAAGETSPSAARPEAAESPSAPRAAAVAGGPLDLGEAAVLAERFPEYDELIRRYFLGPGGAG